MKATLLRDLVLLLAVFAGLWLFFTKVDVFPDSNFEVSIADEEKLGDVLMEQIVLSGSNTEVIANPETDSVMRIINERLLKHVGLTDYEFNILLIRNDEINAVTLPGGNILIFSGLIEFAENPAEVAAVIAHEIGHVQKRHVVNRLAKEFTIEILFSILSGGDLSLLGEIVQSAMATIYDRKQEQEADDYSMELLTKSGISPRSIASFFRRLTREEGTYNQNLEFLMTHPHNNSRIKASLEYELPQDFEEEEIPIDWENFQQMIKTSNYDE